MDVDVRTVNADLDESAPTAARKLDDGQDNLLTDDPQLHHESLAGLGLSRRG